jgi:hypothetical protein
MGHLTRRVPKPLLAPPGCPPLLGTILEGLVGIGVSRLIVCVGFGGVAIRRYLKRKATGTGVELDFVNTPARGVGYAVHACRHRVSEDDPVLLSMADVVCPGGYAPLVRALERVDLALAVAPVAPDPDKRYTGARIGADGALVMRPTGERQPAGRPLIGVYAIKAVGAFFRTLHQGIAAVEGVQLTPVQAVARGILNRRGEYRLSFALQSLAAAGHSAALVDLGPCAEVNRPHHLMRAAQLLRSAAASLAEPAESGGPSPR